MHGQTNIKTLVPFHKSDNADVVLQIVGDSNLDRKLTAPTELLRGFPHTPWQLPSQHLEFGQDNFFTRTFKFLTN